MTSGLRLTMFLQASIDKAGLTNHKLNITPIIGVASHIKHPTNCPISFCEAIGNRLNNSEVSGDRRHFFRDQSITK